MKQRFWLLTRLDKVDYDEYDSMVILANTEYEARELADKRDDSYKHPCNWQSKKQVKCEKLKKSSVPSVILTSFNAG